MPSLSSSPYVFYLDGPRAAADDSYLARHAWRQLAQTCPHVAGFERIPVLRRRRIPPGKRSQEPVWLAYMTVDCDECKPGTGNRTGLLFLNLPYA